MKPTIFPSIMARNQQELDNLLTKMEGVAPTLHLDLVDGKFAANHSLDFSCKLSPKFRYHAHIMAKAPEKWVKKLLRHVDVCIPQLREIKEKRSYIQWMKREKKPVAFAISPETAVRDLGPYAQEIQYVLILTVQPGFYGSPFLKEELRKIPQVKKLNPKIKVIVDGHMDPQNIKLAKNAGADLFVSGSFVTQSKNPERAMKELEQALSLS